MSGQEALLIRLSFFSKVTDVVLLGALFLSLFLAFVRPVSSGLTRLWAVSPLPQPGQAKRGNEGLSWALWEEPWFWSPWLCGLWSPVASEARTLIL